MRLRQSNAAYSCGLQAGMIFSDLSIKMHLHEDFEKYLMYLFRSSPVTIETNSNTM